MYLLQFLLKWQALNLVLGILALLVFIGSVSSAESIPRILGLFLFTVGVVMNVWKGAGWEGIVNGIITNLPLLTLLMLVPMLSIPLKIGGYFQSIHYYINKMAISPSKEGNVTRSFNQGLPGFPGGSVPADNTPGGYPSAPFPGGGSGGGGYPSGPPQGGGQGPGAPQSPPPSFTPTKPSYSIQAIDPGSIRGCINRYVYIWQDNGEQYWVFLTFVGRHSISGYRWYGYGPFGFWLYFGMDIRRIQQFNCF